MHPQLPLQWPSELKGPNGSSTTMMEYPSYLKVHDLLSHMAIEPSLRSRLSPRLDSHPQRHSHPSESKY